MPMTDFVIYEKLAFTAGTGRLQGLCLDMVWLPDIQVQKDNVEGVEPLTVGV